jgi:hypothetical protein
MRYWIIALLVLFIGYFIYQSKSANDALKAASNNADSTISLGTSDQVTKPKPGDYKGTIETKIYFLDSFFRRADRRRDKDDIVAELSDLDGARSVINNAPDSLTKEEKDLLKVLEKKLIKIQKEDYPVLRKNYVQWASKKVWEENMDVESGWEPNYTTIEFIAGAFASRKNIAASQKTVVDMLTELRFKKANYKWIKHDDDYTSYKIDSPEDGDISTHYTSN